MSGHWRAAWIGYDPHPQHELGVFAFRVGYEAPAPKSSLLLRLSADNRYKLLVNGEVVAFGPQRGDASHWFFDTADLGPYLRAGQNWIAALVWNYDRFAPMAQHRVRLGFVAECPDDEALSTPGDWQVAKLNGWGFDMMNSSSGHEYIDVGPGDSIVASVLPRGWEVGKGDGLEWRKPHGIYTAAEFGAQGGGTPWELVPRSIPMMRYDKRTKPLWIRFPNERPFGPTTVEPGRPLILDARELLCAYPRLRLTGPANARVRLTYAEAPVGPQGKGNRSELEGKAIQGVQDRLMLDGGSLSFEPLWWRTFRYLQIEASQPIEVERLEVVETGYPYKVESRFECDDPRVAKLWEVGVRTAERCAGETYFDCPYYEQLQYVGDTRLQVLVHHYLSRDRALQRNAVETLGWSVTPEGLTRSRYPSFQPQTIPPFSLWWLCMLQDEQLYDDIELSEERVQKAQRVIAAWSRMMAGPVERQSWPFADWVEGWNWGEPPGRMHSIIHRLTEALARCALRDLGIDSVVQEALCRDILERCYTGDDGFVRHMDDPSGQASEHAEALYRLALRADGRREPDWPSTLGALPRCTYYFSYYAHEARRTDHYLDELAPWFEQIENGLSTFAEKPEPTRSDCHAWSAHPLIGLFRHVAGVTSAAPGWKRATIEPRPGRLRHFQASIAHPEGDLTVEYDDGRLNLFCPVPFQLVWRGQRARLSPGEHRLS